MKVELKIEAEIEIDKDEYPNITPQMVLNGVRIFESDVCDGFEITTSIEGCNNTSDFFLKDAVLLEKHLHSVDAIDAQRKYHIRPARPDEAGLFYTPHPEEDKRLGAIGHVRMDFGKSGNEFWHTWHPRGEEELNSSAFKAELQQVVDKLREDVLKNRFAMERFCYEHGGKINGGWTQNYGFIVETEHYRYCLRCNPSPGDYNGYLTAYDLDVQRQNMAMDKSLVGRVTYANDDAQEFTDAEAFLKCVREELPYRPTTGFRYEVLTDDSAVRKAVDDIVLDFYGEENPCQQADYEPQPEQDMTMGGM